MAKDDSKRVKAESLLKEIADKQPKNKQCFWCGEVGRLCNSHHLPQSILKNLGKDVSYLDLKKLNEGLVVTSSLGATSGIGAASSLGEINTFKLICCGCDASLFREYENSKNYEKSITETMLFQIMLKNALSGYFETVKQNHLAQELKQMYSSRFVDKIALDKSALGGGAEKGDIYNNNLIFYTRLDYVVPYAYQGSIEISGVLVHICVFPLKSTSVILVLDNSSEVNLDLESMYDPAYVNFLVFKYGRGIFLSDSLKGDITKLVAQNKLPNFLLKEYALGEYALRE
ncbi:MAG: hypothetical protein FWB72_02020 [Firmicutes bacterium]|nr:hypothetical protein [Bacillota bacterium]